MVENLVTIKKLESLFIDYTQLKSLLSTCAAPNTHNVRPTQIFQFALLFKGIRFKQHDASAFSTVTMHQ